MEKTITEIVWTEPAKEDLRDIYDYLAQFSEEAAFRVITRILDKAAVLKDGFTEICQRELLLTHKADVYRYLVEGNYKIIYRVKGNRVIIDTVFDARQNPDKLPDKVE
ncbi:MAG: type II toxin-antitoxin system RelE/ParE family toxin [bacterium]|nr:type II toxin-antitoxin system RelE/ParE family toxin [bacterium]